SVGSLIKLALEKIASRAPGGQDAEKCFKDVSLFLLERFQLMMQDAGFELDEIYSVTRNASDPDLTSLNFISLMDKIDALHAVREHPDFGAMAGAYKRASNILKQ